MPVKPSEQEEEYFAKLEIQKRLQEQEKRAQALAEDEKKRLRELHYMHCPKCGTPLQEEVLHDIAVDICPACHGVWLDDGELGKLTEGGKNIFSFLRGIFS
ncbi:MAG: zf-TFIIB domain-containing protein [Acidobacteria bacterium]|nr:zf-TFIIB domain-containing protein [Acidobacteriota bacterium]